LKELKIKYSDLISSTLKSQGYTTVFFVAGGNIMHLIESFSKNFTMVPVIHEVAAVIATDYFNEVSNSPEDKAFALVTVGPGLTNTVTGLASAYADSREVLLFCGQVKSSDLKLENERSYGVQEIDGISLIKTVAKVAKCLTFPIMQNEILDLIFASRFGRKGPVVLEICLDVQGARIDPEVYAPTNHYKVKNVDLDFEIEINSLQKSIQTANRPIVLIGGGVNRRLSKDLVEFFKNLDIPMCTTWNGADRISSDHDLYAGRPNLYGQRWSNLIIQQADLILVFGSSLGLQQTGFNHRSFAPLAKVLQFDIEPSNRLKSSGVFLETHKVDLDQFIPKLVNAKSPLLRGENFVEWRNFIIQLRSLYPVVEDATVSPGWVNPFEIIYKLSNKSDEKISIVSCSSGGTYTALMQTFQNKRNQILISSKTLGSMGFGASAAIGVSMAKKSVVWLFDGDGGFAQNLQELGTIVANKLPIKLIIMENGGYASIRSTQKRYFKGNYIGCDSLTGVVLPNLNDLARAYGIEYTEIATIDEILNESYAKLLDEKPRIFGVKVSPDQEYLPKINSVMSDNGEMNSNPLHLMYPDLALAEKEFALRYLISAGLFGTKEG
jgi:acetolactate synthase-1/2/3 large subunit